MLQKISSRSCFVDIDFNKWLKLHESLEKQEVKWS